MVGFIRKIIPRTARHAAGREWLAAAAMRWSPPTWQVWFGWEAGLWRRYRPKQLPLVHGIAEVFFLSTTFTRSCKELVAIYNFSQKKANEFGWRRI